MRAGRGLTKDLVGAWVNLVVWLLYWGLVLQDWNWLLAAGGVGVVDGVSALWSITGGLSAVLVVSRCSKAFTHRKEDVLEEFWIGYRTWRSRTP